MEDKDTEDLRKELLSGMGIDTYLRRNREQFVKSDVTELIYAYYERQGISKAVLARQAGMSDVYLHQLFSGRRKPSRDKILCLCIGMELSIEDTQKLLKEAAFAPLYLRKRREAIIYYGILNHQPIEKINDKLFDKNEKTLY